MTPEQARRCFPITETRAYFFSGGLAPAATTVREAQDQWTNGWMCDPTSLYAEYPSEWERLRERFARLIGAEPAEVAIVDNTSRGSNLIVQMLDAPPSSNVVVDEYTYPSSMYAWKLAPKAHVEIREVRARDNRIETDELARLVDDRTFAISISHVSPMTGFRHDLAALAELAHSHGAFLIVDAAQSAGALDLDVRRLGVDFLSTCAMKWLLGAPGVAFMYVAREHVDRFDPPQVGYVGVKRSFEITAADTLEFVSGARRHEQGLPALPSLAASRAAIDLLLEVGTTSIEPHVLELSGRCVEGLLQRNMRIHTRPEPEYRAGVVAVPVVGGQKFVTFMRERAVDVWTNPGQDLLRIDPHLFNNSEDVARFFAGLDDFRSEFGKNSLQPQ